MKKELMLIPSGGLANRMRAIASAYNLTQQVGSRLQVVWFRDWALHAPFRDIFMPVEQLSLRDATVVDHLLYDRPRRRNLYVPELPQRLLFERRIHERSVSPLKERGFDFAEWARGHHCYMSCYQVFGSFPNTLYGELFHPVSAVTDGVERFRQQFSSHTIGLHIRRTDNAESIASSPTQLFVEAVEREVDAHADTKVFLATDSEEVKAELCRRFAGRILFQQAAADRSSTDGIRGGLIDMYTLAATHAIYGSAGSSFSPMAAAIGGNVLHVLSI